MQTLPMSSVRIDAIVAAGSVADTTPDTTRDAFLDGRLTILQPKSGPRAAIDALFLAAAIPVEAGKAQSVLEAGIATGVASLALCARVAGVQVTGVEVQPELLELARENARLNNMQDRLMLVEADITAHSLAADNAGLSRQSFDHVMANPPYFTVETSRKSSNTAKARAYSGEAGDLEKWVGFLTAMAKPRGTVTIVHRADALGELLALLDGRFGGISVFPLFPRKDEPAKRVLVQGIKGSRAPLRLLSGMALHEADGAYTLEADAVLRHMAAIELGRS